MSNTLFNERKALQMQLESLLKLRFDLRTEFVEREKVIASDINEVIRQVRLLDQTSPSDLNIMNQGLPGDNEHPPIIKDEVEQIRKQNRSRINYQEIESELSLLMFQAPKPVSLKDIQKSVEEKLNIRLSNPYITIKKVAKNLPNVKEVKQGKVLCFYWENN
ncbi:hypothetical protein POF51_25760 [Brevibacillus sp. AG]|uniref:hypothetical protein n=1 Tax=Brevibacillus sp. AG TaxID=3020891 RepID=UPI00232C28F2|nr:hypothetical protein [Brevibacillus sp. AG]MDC0764129.1 hypothetical protein [Brevibacillus sp. AG]